MPRRRRIHFLRLYLADAPEAMCLRIRTADARRFERALNAYRPGYSGEFFCWDSPSGVSVVVSLRFLQSAQVLWDRPGGLDADPSAFSRDRAELRLIGRLPIDTGAEPELELYELVQMFELDPPPFVSFLDEDAERLWFRPDQLVYLTVPKWLMQEGCKQYEALEREETEAWQRKQAAEQHELVIFAGHDGDGRLTELVQHHSQVNFQLTAEPHSDGVPRKAIGFEMERPQSSPDSAAPGS